jgi:N-acetyltransferase
MDNRTWIRPIIMCGEHVKLEPMQAGHATALGEAAQDGELWRLWFTGVPDPATVVEYVTSALERQKKEGGMPFVVRHRASGEIIGTTRYLHVDGINRRLEIGSTWYAKSHQRTAVNTECKLLLLAHAFETLAAIAVEFRTHWHNRASRAAIERLGAKQDGVLRQHSVGRGGGYRDTVVFSILDSEWPATRQNLDFRLGRD